MSKEEKEELEDDDVEVEVDTRFNLYWTCPNCHNDNAEYDITIDGVVKCVCDICKNEYTYYHSIY